MFYSSVSDEELDHSIYPPPSWWGGGGEVAKLGEDGGGRFFWRKGGFARGGGVAFEEGAVGRFYRQKNIKQEYQFIDF